MQVQTTVAPRRVNVLSNPVLGMVIFIMTEIMIFSSFISSFTIIKSSFNNWPPMGQPRLPAETTAINSLFLLASAWFLHKAYTFFVKEGGTQKTKRVFQLALGFGLLFLGLQGAEWIRLISYGLTMTSSVYGSFFYLIVGAHGLHLVGAVLGLLLIYSRLIKGTLTKESFSAMRAFWFFVVLLWPVLYGLVYL